jgi:diaminohydroxyphosphoribosylaminopyrimidine deaminase/5-amino-6-(5-phosphoribosylamino)uracil reductase
VISDLDQALMLRALAIARQGEGFVEPNPMVGCIIAQQDRIVGTGWHQRFGGSHAEINAINDAGNLASGGIMYVTLEPCCHFGKTPPCTRAIVRAGVRRVVVSIEDPHPQVSGRGIAELRESGIDVEVGACQAEARELIAPFHKLVSSGRPWVIAKWAMTLDGKLATRTGDSKWISNESCRQRTHALRGRVDSILVGSRTVIRDDPLLTARPPGARLATRVVLDSQASIPITSQIVQSAGKVPVLLAVGPDVDLARAERLIQAGCEVWQGSATTHLGRVEELLDELGRRRMTNVLVEGGAGLLGNLFDLDAVDEVRVFIGPMIVGGQSSPSAVAGQGVAMLNDARRWTIKSVETIGGDVYLHGVRLGNATD